MVTDAFARLFESVHEGVYIGTVSGDNAETLSANPYLKLIFGYSSETPTEEVRPFATDRFVDIARRVHRAPAARSIRDRLLVAAAARRPHANLG
jgi:hypothetical protein